MEEHLACGLYPALETAKSKDLDPFHFMHRMFEELPEAGTEEILEKLLPWNMTGIPSYKSQACEN